MKISAISTFMPAFKGSSMPIPEGAVLRYDEGQPYIAFPVGKRGDSFERSSKPAHKEADYNSIEEAIAAGAPGFRHEDFLY